MQINLIAIGTRMPAWVNDAYNDYASRLPHECSLHLTEVTAGKRTRHANLNKICIEEGQKMMSAIPKSSKVIALDMTGKPWSTEELSAQLESWMQAGNPVSLLVGGPEGLSAECRQCAHQAWSLSRLTLPHPMVRVIVAEQLYRAWSMLNNHPYHR